MRKITVWVFMLFDPATGTSRCWTYNNSAECLDNFLLYRNSTLFPRCFSHTFYVGPSHPLYHLGQPIKHEHGEFKIN